MRSSGSFEGRSREEEKDQVQLQFKSALAAGLPNRLLMSQAWTGQRGLFTTRVKLHRHMLISVIPDALQPGH